MDEKIKYLEFIQQAINRMASNSFLLKGWSITLISILFALAINDSNPKYLLFALFPTFAFWILDSYYLRQERLFRELYNNKRKNLTEDKDLFSFDVSSYNNKVDSWFCTFFTPTISLIHGTIFILICLISIAIKFGGI